MGEKLITFLGLSVGGYLLYESGLLSSLTGGLIPAPAGSSTSSGASSSTSVSNSGGQPSNPSSPPPGTPNTKALVQARATADKDPALQTFDAWNYVYQEVRGVPGPSPDTYLTPATRNMNLSIDEWWAYMQKAGFSGLTSRKGFAGCSACMGTKGGYVRTSNLQPAGMGRWIY
jgi:hypothetical protein